MSVSAHADPLEVGANAENGANGGLTEVELRAVIAVAAHRARWWIGAEPDWLTSRMNWSPEQVPVELARLQRRGLIACDDGQLLASREGVKLALAAWHAMRVERARRSRPS